MSALIEHPIGAFLLACCLAWGLGCRSTAPEPFRVFFFVDQVPGAEGSFDRGELIDLRQEGHLSASVTLAGETQRALTPSLPAKLTFAVEIPPQPVLQFAIAVATAGGRPNQRSLAEFRIGINTGEGDQTCFRYTLRRHQRNQWLERQVDLTPWAGTRANISFEVSGVSDRSESEEQLFPLWGNPVMSSGSGSAPRPNLVLISVDCLRPDHMGTYGYQKETTPHIDAFAEGAVVFETAVSTSSWTVPTHMSMLTGLLPSLHGATRRSKPDRSVPYLPDLLTRAGYQVDGVASGIFLSQKFGFETSFHNYRAFDDSRARVTIDSAIGLLRRSRGREQYLFVHLYDPHWPYRPPAGFVERFGQPPQDISLLNANVAKDKPPSAPGEKERIVRLYDAEIAYLDQEVGRFLDALKSTGLYERSLIVITADHGEAFYDHGHWRHTYSLYDEILRVPLIVKWPGRSPRGRVSVQVSQVDIFPTLLEEAGLVPPHSGALNLRSYLESERDSSSALAISEVVIPSETSPDLTMKFSLRTQESKYIATLGSSDGVAADPFELQREELYRLADDPGEHSNLAQQLPQETEIFRQKLFAYLERVKRFGARGKGEPVELDDELRERLRALGYVVR